MKRKFYYLLVSIIILSSSINVIAQDFNYSQFYFKEMYYNPAFTGINPGLRGIITNRQFWTNVPGLYSSTNLCVDFYDMKFANGGLGIIVNSFTKGENYIFTNTAGLAYAKRIGVTPDLLFQVGASASFVQKSLNYYKLIFTDQLDPRFGAIYQTEFDLTSVDKQVRFVDFSAGAVSRFNIMQTSTKAIAINNFGIALHHLTQPNEAVTVGGEARVPMKVNMHAYSTIRIDRNAFYNAHFLLAPGIMYETQRETSSWFEKDAAGAKTLAFGFHGIIPSRMSFVSSIFAGVWARKQFHKLDKSVVKDVKNKSFDAVVFMLGYIKYSRDRKKLHRVAYSYDLTVPNAGLATGGTHEITLSFEIHDLALPGGKRSYKFVKNPADRFFGNK